MAIPRLQPGQRAGTRLIPASACNACACSCRMGSLSPQGVQPRPSQMCPAQPTPGCCSLPAARLPYLRYLYIVSASTSPNQTLRCAWKYSPCTSSMATSPPPVSCDGQSVWQCYMEGARLLPWDALPAHPIPKAPQKWEMPHGCRGSGAGGTRQAGDREGAARGCAHLQGSDERHGADGLADAGQALAEGVLHRLRADDGPA